MNGKGVYVDAEEEVEPVMHAPCKVNPKGRKEAKEEPRKASWLGSTRYSPTRSLAWPQLPNRYKPIN